MDRSELQRALGLKITPDKFLLYQQALVHTSYVNEHPEEALESNERMEFLGDAVLQLVVGEYLYNAYGSLPEGELTRVRSAVVSTPALAAKGAELGLGKLLLLGKGEEQSGGRSRPSLLENAMEAVVGAVFLDGGMGKARSFVLKSLSQEMAEAARGEARRDWKTSLQEASQQKGLMPTYHVVGESGPDHDKTFDVAVLLGGKEAGRGRGRSKKEAEQAAARAALAGKGPARKRRIK